MRIPKHWDQPEYDENGRLNKSLTMVQHAETKVLQLEGWDWEKTVKIDIHINGHKGNSSPTIFLGYDAPKEWGHMTPEIAKAFDIPEEFLALIGRNIEGVPIHAYENGQYHLSRLDFTILNGVLEPDREISMKERQEIVESHFMATVEELEALWAGCLYLQPKKATKFLIEELKPKWSNLAQVFIDWLDRRTQQ